MTQAGKVAEIFSVAGDAFTQLANLAMRLQPASTQVLLLRTNSTISERGFRKGGEKLYWYKLNAGFLAFAKVYIREIAFSVPLTKVYTRKTVLLRSLAKFSQNFPRP